MERDGDFSIDRSEFDPVTGRVNTERTLIRGGRTRRFTFSVRMFVALELRAWLSDAGFTSIESYDGEGELPTRQGRRMITVAHR